MLKIDNFLIHMSWFFSKYEVLQKIRFLSWINHSQK